MASDLYVRIDVFGDEGVEMLLGSMIEHAENMAPAYAIVGEGMRAYEEELFASEGAISGNPWAPLSEETLRTKRQKGYPSDIEKATLALFHSLVDETDSDHIEEITPEFMRYGTRASYGAAQQEGTNKAPARPIINFRERDLQGFTMVMANYIRHGLLDASVMEI